MHLPSAFNRHPRPARGSLLLFVAGSLLCLTAANAASEAPTPPDFADEAHVPNGCVLSALVYAARFSASHPDHPIRLVEINSPMFGGRHTVAVLKWNDRWCGRDEHFGLFPLPGFDDRSGREAQAARVVRSALERHAEAALRREDPRRDGTGRSRPVAAAAAVNRAAALLPFPSTAVTLLTDRGSCSFLYFRPDADRIAVYDPRHGTALAGCRSTDADAVVRAVAERLGYRVLPESTEPKNAAAVARR